MAFGGFAIALGLASLVNAWDVSCEVGELLDNLRHSRDEAHVLAKEARQAPVIKEHDGAVKMAATIRKEHAEAAEQHAAAVRRMKYAALGRNPGVAGHGTVNGPKITEADINQPEPAVEPETPKPTNGHHPDRDVPPPTIVYDGSN